MSSLRIAQILLLAAGLTAAIVPAFPQAAQPRNREAALSGLRSPDAATRAEAVTWIANRGSMDDAPLLHDRLRGDESAFVRGFAEQGLWLLWSRSGDAEVDRLMARGTDEMNAGRHREAIQTFSEVIRRKPDFAEGWNRRATVYYLDGDNKRSIADCDEVLRRNPLHFGALSGLGQIYLRMDEPEEALKWFRRALDVNPGLIGVSFNIKAIEEQLKQRRRRTI